MNQDQTIIAGIINGDQFILNNFYLDQRKYVKSYILKNSGNIQDVEDIFQDALLLLYQKLYFEQLKITVSLNTYFFSICKNMWRNQLRGSHKKTMTDHIPPNSNEEITDYLQHYLENIERELLYKKCFQKLSMSNQLVLELFFQGKSMQEIALETGLSEKYTRKKKYDAKKKLLEILEKDPMYQELKFIKKTT